MIVIDPAATDRDRVILGRINGVFGTRGWLKIYSYTRPRDNILSYPTWALCANHTWQMFDVIAHRRQGAGFIASLNGISEREEAVALVGSEIAVDREALPRIGAGEYYWANLIGLEVFDQRGTILGTVTGLLETGANDVLVVGGAKERLIPYVKDRYVIEVDVEHGRMVVDWHEND